jgi:ATP-dependent helicase HrpA
MHRRNEIDLQTPEAAPENQASKVKPEHQLAASLPFRPDFRCVATRLQARLRGTWQRVQKLDAAQPERRRFMADFEKAQTAVALRRARVPAVAIDEALPIARYAAELTHAIATHQVVIVAGETGSGKTTQLPKLCLAAGRGVLGMIGCTQPRRIAAKTVAKRVAQELNCELGALVGWQVRFTEAVGEQTLIKFMTDGILLAETQSDRLLANYDTIIIDEAHERSLNIDFLLGFIKKLLPKRPDLKIIITSATIDTARFSAHFNQAPVFTVEGRGFPVEIRYRPILGDEDERNERAQPASIIAAIDELNRDNPMGDVLVFFPGEREIRDAQAAIERRNFRETEVVSLFARLSAAEQDKVFQPGPKRRIVLATNVAETSITVPRIRFVIDTGTARISRYSPRSKIERLHIESISQASANQRAGRCGRVAAGVCVRLYDEADYQSRAAFTDPEILRSSLAGVLLRMLKLHLGDPRAFPFVEPPDERAINDGYLVLAELGAIDARRALTELGTQMAELPIDVHYARMLIAAKSENCLKEMLILTAGLSIQDPRERPADKRGSADAAHATFSDERSDFLGWLKLWDAYQFQSNELSQSKLRDWARNHFLSFLRLREWRDLHQQLSSAAREQGWVLNTTGASFEALHRALLTALIGQVGEHDEKGVYKGTRQRKFQIFPGSAIKGSPRWVMADTLLDTQKVWAIGVAKIEPAWLESIGAHLIKKRYYDPLWDERAGRVMCFEDATLLGLTVYVKRRAQYEAVNPEETRALFLRHALAMGETSAPHRLFAHNAAVRTQAHAKEDKLRKRGLLKTESEIAEWFEAKIPADIRSVPALLAWLKSPLGRDQEAHLRLHVNDLILHTSPLQKEFPDELVAGGFKLALRYQFDPSSEADGATASVKLEQLGALELALLDWLVPGLREEKAAALIKSLPKHLRRLAVPAPDFARAFLEAHAPSAALSLCGALAMFLSKVCGETFNEGDFDLDALPNHLRLRIEVLGPAGEVLAQGRDIAALQTDFRSAARAAFTAKVGALYNRDHLKVWPFDLPEQITSDDGSAAYPALDDTGNDANLRAYASADEAAAHHANGALRLLRLHLPDEQRYWRKHASLSAAAMLAYAAVDAAENLRLEIVEACLIAGNRELAAKTRSLSEFHHLSEHARTHLGPDSGKLAALLDDILCAYGALRRKLTPPVIGLAKANLDDIRAQLAGLIYRKCVLEVPAARLAHYPRYLKAIAVRLERLFNEPIKDQTKMLDLLPFMAIVECQRHAPNAQALRWLLEEFRVSIFAPELKTAEAVSVKRLRALAENL